MAQKYREMELEPYMSDGRSSTDTIHAHSLLLVEDNPGDARLIKEAFSPVLADRLHIVSAGDEALDFVHQRGDYVDSPRPDLILLDWHLPGMDGEEVLAELKTNSDHNHIPVIVLTGTQSEQEVRNAYAKNANACINKIADVEELKETFRVFENFWFSASELPSPAYET